MQKRVFIIIGLVIGLATAARAQYDPSFSHYFDMEPSFNAGAVGKQSKLNIVGAYALDFAGFSHNPKTMYFAADMPFYALGRYHGVGARFMNDQIGLFQHQQLLVQYAFKQRLFGGMLSVGLQAGLLSEKFDGSKADPEDASDPAISTSDVNGNGIDLSAGLYYTHGPWYAGLSVLHATGPTIDLGETNELKIDPTFYFTAGYNIKLRNPFLTIKPSALVRTDGVAWRGDITARLVYTNDKKVMYGGVGYSPTNSVTFLVGGMVHGIMLGYSYELYTSAINPGNGSHELFIGYQMDLNLVKKGKNLHKSVRIL